MSNPPNPEDTRKQIIDFVKTYYQQYGKPPTVRTINNTLKVNIYKYFKGMKELCEKAGVPYEGDEDDIEEIEKKIEEVISNAIKSIENKFEEIALRISTEVAKKSNEEFFEKTIKPMINSYFDRFKLLENELTSMKENIEHKVAEERYLELEGTKIKRTLTLSPITIQYYDYYITKTGDKIDLGEFIDNVVDEHFRECLGIEVGVIVRPGGGIRRAR